MTSSPSSVRRSAGAGTATAAGERLVWHFKADSVADFAWGASPNYVWQATRVQVPGGRTIPLNIYYQRSRAAAFAQVPAVGRHAVEFYSKLWMPYAFPQLTVLDGPELGMEYPMLVMSGLGALDHEIGHEWWPMMVGVNETWYGFMDEGFNQYMNILSGADREPAPAGARLAGHALRPDQRQRAGGAAHVERQLRRPHVPVPGLPESTADALEPGRRSWATARCGRR